MKLAIVAFVFMGACFAQLPVTGRIVDDIDGQPVANARVKLLNDAVDVPIVRTDGDGRFVFSVPEGTYKLAVEKAGFFPYPNDPIEVREGDPGDLALVLTKTRSITARLAWPDGEPGSGLIMVRSMTGTLAGDGGVDPTGTAFTSDLRPGRYYISIDPQFRATPGRRGMVMQFPSPDVVERGEAIDLRFTATQDLGTISIPEATGVEVSGRFEITEKISMTNFGGSQKTQPSIDLIGPDGGQIARINGQPDGTFRFPKVPPGTYYLVGNTQIPNYVTFGVQEIRVGATPISGLVLALPDAPPTIPVHTEIETPQGVVGLLGIPVGAKLTQPATATVARVTDAEGNFSIPVPTSPGGPIPNLQLRLTNRLPTDAYIASVTQGQATYTRDPFPIAVSAEPVRVLFKRDGATIQGQAAITGNPPHAPYIVLAPKEREAALYYRTATTDHNGVFQLQAIAPGTYDLFAFDREANYAGDQTLRAYQDAAISVTVAAGESLTVNPNVVRIEK